MAQFDLVGLVARDMAASLKFYRLLGLEIPDGAEKEDHVEYVTAGGFRLAWDTLELVKSLNEDWVAPAGFRMTMAFKCANATEVDTLYAQVTKAGYPGHRAPWDAFWGQRYAVVVDPDGNLV